LNLAELEAVVDTFSPGTIISHQGWCYEVRQWGMRQLPEQVEYSEQVQLVRPRPNTYRVDSGNLRSAP
jgi:hypothetical protein